MAVSGKVVQLTASAQTNITILRGIIVVGGAGADTVVTLQAGSSSGTTFLTFKEPTTLRSTPFPFGDGITCPLGQVYCTIAGTATVTVTLWGD
jgi:hypothetical protein